VIVPSPYPGWVCVCPNPVHHIDNCSCPLRTSRTALHMHMHMHPFHPKRRRQILGWWKAPSFLSLSLSPSYPPPALTVGDQATFLGRGRGGAGGGSHTQTKTPAPPSPPAPPFYWGGTPPSSGRARAGLPNPRACAADGDPTGVYDDHLKMVPNIIESKWNAAARRPF
jgi:hypothetical protein